MCSCSLKILEDGREQVVFFRIFFGGIFVFILYSTLFHLPPLRFHCADGCWERTQDRCNWCIGSQTTRLDLIRTSLDLIRTRLDLIRSRLDLIRTRLDLIRSRLDLIRTRLDLMRSRLDLIRTWLDLIRARLDLIRN